MTPPGSIDSITIGEVYAAGVLFLLMWAMIFALLLANRKDG